MQSTITNKEGNKVSLKIEVESKKFEDAVQKSYMKNRGRFNIPGFRKGKVPRKIIEVNYGEGVFYEDAINIVFPEAYEKAIEDHNLDPVDRPDVDIEEIEKGKPVVFTAEVTVKPEVTLGEYKGIEVEKVEYNVTEEEIDKELKNMQEQNGRIIEVEDRPVQNGDTLTIDYAGFVGEEQFEGGTAQNQTLEIGSGRFIPGFEEQLVGKNKGEEVEVNVTFPEEYQAENLAGKDATFKVTIHEIKEKELPELDDELAKDVSEFDTLEELKNDIKNRLEESSKNREEAENQNNVLAKVVEASEVEIPEVMIERQVDSEVNDFSYRLQFQGLDINKYFELTNTTMEDLRSQMKENAEKVVRNDLILEAIAKAEGIEPTDEEIDNEIEKMAKQYNQEADKLKKSLRESDMDYIKMGIINKKTLDFLLENAKLS